MTRHLLLSNEELAVPEIACVRCHRKSFAAGRNRNRICLVCEAHQRRKEGR